MLASATQLSLLTRFLAVLTTVLSVRTVLGDHAGAAWVSTFIHVSHDATSRSLYAAQGRITTDLRRSPSPPRLKLGKRGLPPSGCGPQALPWHASRHEFHRAVEFHTNKSGLPRGNERVYRYRLPVGQFVIWLS